MDVGSGGGVGIDGGGWRRPASGVRLDVAAAMHWHGGGRVLAFYLGKKQALIYVLYLACDLIVRQTATWARKLSPILKLNLKKKIDGPKEMDRAEPGSARARRGPGN